MGRLGIAAAAASGVVEREGEGCDEGGVGVSREVTSVDMCRLEGSAQCESISPESARKIAALAVLPAELSSLPSFPSFPTAVGLGFVVACALACWKSTGPRCAL